jgi:hypothetical protein
MSGIGHDKLCNVLDGNRLFRVAGDFITLIGMMPPEPNQARQLRSA